MTKSRLIWFMTQSHAILFETKEAIFMTHSHAILFKSQLT